MTKYETPTPTGTVSEGYVEHAGERYAYREVDWDEERETTALLAANKHSGEWDRDMLSVLVHDVKIDLDLTGFEMPELKALNIEVPEVKIPEPEKEEEEEEEESDEAYIRNNPGPEEGAGSTVQSELNAANPFDQVEEKTEVEGKRYVIIIDCKDEAMKQELREKLRPQIIEAGARIF